MFEAGRVGHRFEAPPGQELFDSVDRLAAAAEAVSAEGTARQLPGITAVQFWGGHVFWCLIFSSDLLVNFVVFTLVNPSPVLCAIVRLTVSTLSARLWTRWEKLRCGPLQNRFALADTDAESNEPAPPPPWVQVQWMLD